MAGKKKARTATRSTAGAVRKQREIQGRMDRRDEKGSKQGKKKAGAVQAGERRQPVDLPAQHLAKPGHEHELEEEPRYLAPDYRGSGKLEGRVALITGGDSGIGRAVAVLFAREGADVAIVYLSEEEDARQTSEAVENEGRTCLRIAGDVKDPEFCSEAVDRTLEAFGHLDILVNNSAFQEHSESLEDISEEHLQETLQTNIGGYFHMARAAVPHMQEGGAIINTGSETGLFGNPMLLDYSATKGAIHAFTRSLALNLKNRGIRVNAVAPGPVWTPLNPADRPPGRWTSSARAAPWAAPRNPKSFRRPMSSWPRRCVPPTSAAACWKCSGARQDEDAMMMMTDGDLCTLRFRFDGEGEQVATLVAMMRSMDNVDRVVEVGTDAAHMREDSSSAGLSDDDIRSDFHDVEVHAIDRDAAEQARDLVEVAARDLGVVVEYVDRF